MSVTKSRAKAGKKSARIALRTKAAASRSKNARPVVNAAAGLRARFLLTQAQFAPMLSVSIRSLASLEAGAEPTSAVARRMSELARLAGALSEVMDGKAIGGWMVTPNTAFAGLKPLEVIERGEVDRIWAMIHALRSGEAS